MYYKYDIEFYDEETSSLNCVPIYRAIVEDQSTDYLELATEMLRNTVYSCKRIKEFEIMQVTEYLLNEYEEVLVEAIVYRKGE